ncbi:Leptomycin B resistance protein pmd1 [Purpureocillium lavendulum]|uniref:Leptomycin B resistance protein pmd1 n=1 Tax=Purpureocillium lavendulum TaxID=1247861 RepID=A0AB34FPZ6_9HYPO|nr:Leptomycin B resistance protein pmd1 [Purpureocillium lavendulum]
MGADAASTSSYARKQCLIKLSRAFLLYGAPTHSIEEFMAISSATLDIDAHFLYVPMNMVVTFDDGTRGGTELHIIRLEPGIEVGRLMEVFRIYKDLVHAVIDVEEATRRLDDALDRKPKFSIKLRVLMYGLASACCAPVAFQGRMIDTPIALILGSAVGLFQEVWYPADDHFIPLFEMTAGIITAFIARALGSIQNGDMFCFGAIAQSSIVFILPGYMVLSSSLELHTGHIVAGSARMVHAVISTLFLGYGMAIGTCLYGLVDSGATTEVGCRDQLERKWQSLLALAFIVCQCIIRQAQWRQMPAICAIALVGFWVNSFCSRLFDGDTHAAAMLGALSVGLLSNLHFRLYRPAQTLWFALMSCLESTSRWCCFTEGRNLVNRWARRPSYDGDAESPPLVLPKGTRVPRKGSCSLAVAVMLQAILIQLPTSLAIHGFLAADTVFTSSMKGNPFTTANGSRPQDGARLPGSLDMTFFGAFWRVIQGIVGVSFGLLISNMIAYPLGRGLSFRKE